MAVLSEQMFKLRALNVLNCYAQVSCINIIDVMPSESMLLNVRLSVCKILMLVCMVIMSMMKQVSSQKLHSWC